MAGPGPCPMCGGPTRRANGKMWVCQECGVSWELAHVQPKEAAVPEHKPDELERALADVVEDRCPRCAGELDTGWECTNRGCRFDAMVLKGLAKDWLEANRYRRAIPYKILKLIEAWHSTTDV